MVCPRSWSWRSLRKPTAWPSVKSGALGSNPILRRRARPEASAAMNSSRGMIPPSATARSVIQRSSSSVGTRALRSFWLLAPPSLLLTIRLKPLPRRLHILLHLRDQLLGRRESLFSAQAVQQVDLHFSPVDVLVEVEDECLNDWPRLDVESGPYADAGARFVCALPHVGARHVDAVCWQGAVEAERDVRGREAEVPAAAVAGHDRPAQRERPPKQPPHALDIAGSQCLADGARADFLVCFSQQRRHFHAEAEALADLSHHADRTGPVTAEREIRTDHKQPHLQLLHEQREEVLGGELREFGGEGK